MSTSKEGGPSQLHEVSSTRELELAHEQRKIAVMKDLIKLEDDFLQAYLCPDLRRVRQMHEVDLAMRRLLVRMRRVAAYARKAANITDEEWTTWLSSERDRGRSIDEIAPTNEPDIQE